MFVVYVWRPEWRNVSDFYCENISVGLNGIMFKRKSAFLFIKEKYVVTIGTI